MLIDEIMQYLAVNVSGSQIVYGASSALANIHMSDLPKEPSSTGIDVAVRPTGGYLADAKFGYDDPTVQILIRGSEDARTGYNLALEVYQTLQGFHGGSFVVNGIYIVMCEGLQSEPADLGRDETDRVVYSLNFHLHIKRSSIHRQEN